MMHVSMQLKEDFVPENTSIFILVLKYLINGFFLFFITEEDPVLRRKYCYTNSIDASKDRDG